MRKFRFGILKSDSDSQHEEWISACRNFRENVDYDVIDLVGSDWLSRVQSQEFDGFLARPPCGRWSMKQLYDERLYVLNHLLGRFIYPSLDECLIYENKRLLASWLAANRMPHAKTWVFYDKEEAVEFAGSCRLPIVGKTIIGAGGSGVRILKDRNSLEEYIDACFSGKGLVRRGGPNLRKGDLLRRAYSRLCQPREAIAYFRKKSIDARSEPQKGYVLLQEFVDAKWEWRCVNIGNSFFGHKKLRRYGEMMSGTSNVEWTRPPERLLELVRDVCKRGNFWSQAVDVFEDGAGNYFINEMQCCFGSKNAHQMIIDGTPGRFMNQNGEWKFEEGEFNRNNSYNLRLEHVLELIEDRTASASTSVYD